MGHWVAGKNFVNQRYGVTVHIQAHVEGPVFAEGVSKETPIDLLLMTHDGAQDGSGELLLEKLKDDHIGKSLEYWEKRTLVVIRFKGKLLKFSMRNQNSICN